MATPAVCPLDSRRGETEVFIKRVAVMFTVLCLLGHLNSLRGMKGPQRLSICIFLFIFNPVYPLLTLLADIGWAILKARTDAHQPYAIIYAEPDRVGPPAYYVAAAIGVHAAFDETDSSGVVTKMSTSLLHLPPSASDVEEEDDAPGIKGIGRLIILGVAAMQCSMTIVLGVRRELRGAATLLDRRSYLFAASGLAILAQTLFARALSRTYTTVARIAYVEQHGLSIFIEVLHYLVSLCLISYYVGDGVINCGLLLVAMFAINPFMWPWHECSVGCSWQELWDNPMGTIWNILPSVAILLLIPGSLAAMSFWFFIWISYNPTSDQFTDMLGQPAPTDVPCPLLWRDPLADALWAF